MLARRVSSMICPACQGNLRITHCYKAVDGSSTSRGDCRSCQKVYALARVVLCEARFGRGAVAVANDQNLLAALLQKKGAQIRTPSPF